MPNDFASMLKNQFALQQILSQLSPSMTGDASQQNTKLLTQWAGKPTTFNPQQASSEYIDQLSSNFDSHFAGTSGVMRLHKLGELYRYIDQTYPNHWRDQSPQNMQEYNQVMDAATRAFHRE